MCMYAVLGLWQTSVVGNETAFLFKNCISTKYLKYLISTAKRGCILVSYKLQKIEQMPIYGYSRTG